MEVEDRECDFRSHSFLIFSGSAGERTFVGDKGGLRGVDGGGLECAIPLGAVSDGTDAVDVGPGKPVMSGAIMQHLLNRYAGERVL